MTSLTCFKAYDVRGRLGSELNVDIAYRIGRAFAEVMRARTVVVGRDCRETSEELATAITEGLRDGGTDVTDIGLCGTEEIYFATDHLDADGGLMVTASHNPIDYNGVKMVAQGARPISFESGLGQIKETAEKAQFVEIERRGVLAKTDTRATYATHVLRMLDISVLKPLKILANAGNGVAGPALDEIAAGLAKAGAPIEFVRLNHTPDGTFPNGIPNPLLEKNRPMTAEAVIETGADIGIAWDGDFDRCFFFDETGAFIDGEYLVGLLGASFLGKSAGSKIVHDPRVVLNTRAVVEKAGGEAVMSKTGHAFVKSTMREADAIYGGEMSAHHYFRDFMYCDSGMVPWLMVIEHMSRTGDSLSSLVADMKKSFPSSGEINFRHSNPGDAAKAVEDVFISQAELVDRLDGLSLEFPNWRFNLRQSNTEPLLRLNVETVGDPALLAQRVEEITALIEGTST
jgi:phosphomannomutase